MPKIHSTKPPKPAKPYDDFPLFPHATGRWAKKIRGKLHYFGPWKDPDAALQSYLAQKDALHSGRKPMPATDGLTIKEVVNAFLNFKQDQVQAGELGHRYWDDLKTCCDLLIKHFGKSRRVDDLHPDEFANLRKLMSRKWGAIRIGNVVQRVRSVFKFALENGMIDKLPVYGQGFKRPSRRVIRLERAEKGKRMFEADELRKIIDAADTQLKAMILLGINCGFGNHDCGTLPLHAVDLNGGWTNYHRPKTGITRRCALWPETVAALRTAIEHRPKPKTEVAGPLLFVTKYGKPWAKNIPGSPISHEMRKLLDKLGINGARNFYCLRHTFETIAGESKDQVAVDAVMGHVRDDMASHYRERISDQRLRDVADCVRRWLFDE